MPTRNIDLTEHHDQLVEELVEAGKYKNASEVMRAGLRLLEQQARTDDQKVALLRQLATVGFEALDQGQGLPFTADEQLADAISQIGRRAAKTASPHAAP